MTVIPKHIAVIMDGNNRYAKAHALERGGGHIKGKEALDPIVEFCLAKGVQALTLFAFSSENWARPKDEVDLLMDLLAKTIQEQASRVEKYRVRLRFIGDRSRLSADLRQLMDEAERQSAHFDAMTLVIAIAYGGRWDIAKAARALAQKAQTGQLEASQIDENSVGARMELADLPDVDMLIRTGGEYRLSNFLLWQAAYAELFFSPTLWPDFGVGELQAMLDEFAQRERRFGKTSEQLRS